MGITRMSAKQGYEAFAEFKIKTIAENQKFINASVVVPGSRLILIYTYMHFLPAG